MLASCIGVASDPLLPSCTHHFIVLVPGKTLWPPFLSLDLPAQSATLRALRRDSDCRAFARLHSTVTQPCQVSRNVVWILAPTLAHNRCRTVDLLRSALEMQPVASTSKQQLPAREPSYPGTPHTSTPSSSSRPRWMQYGGYYRQIEDITQPWVPSPRISSPMPVPNVPVFDINLHYKAGEVSSLNSSSSSSTWSPISGRFVNAQLRTPATQSTPLPKKRFSSLRRIAGRLTGRRTKPGACHMLVQPLRN